MPAGKLKIRRRRDSLRQNRLVLRPSRFKSGPGPVRMALIKASPCLSAFCTRLVRPISMAKWLSQHTQRFLPTRTSRVQWLTKPGKWLKQFRKFFASKVPSQTARTTWLSRSISILNIFGNSHHRPTLNDKRALLDNNPLIYG